MLQKLARRVAPIAALAFAAALSGCAYMDSLEEVEGVALSEFDMSGNPPTDIVLAGSDKVVITDGDMLEITLDGSAEAGEAMRFHRDGDRLSIARDSQVFDGSGSAIVRIAMPAPQELTVAGSGTIEAASMTRDASIEIAGSGRIEVANIEAENLEVEIAGSGKVKAVGNTERLSVEIAGSGNVQLGELMADDVSVEIAGSGNVELASNGTVDAEIAGSGDIVVTGTATCTLDSAGNGSLRCQPGPQAADAAGSDEGIEEAAAE